MITSKYLKGTINQQGKHPRESTYNLQTVYSHMVEKMIIELKSTKYRFAIFFNYLVHHSQVLHEKKFQMFSELVHKENVGTHMEGTQYKHTIYTSKI